MEPIDGIMGMSLNRQFLLVEEDVEIGPLYVEHMVTEGLLEKAEFSFYLQPPGIGSSHVDFGPPQVDLMKGGTGSMTEIPTNDDFFWSQWMQAIAFSSTDNGYSFEGGFPYTILDTGSSHLFVPEEFYETIIINLIEEAGNPEYLIQDGITLVECSDNFKPMFVMFDNHWI